MTDNEAGLAQGKSDKPDEAMVRRQVLRSLSDICDNIHNLAHAQQGDVIMCYLIIHSKKVIIHPKAYHLMDQKETF